MQKDELKQNNIELIGQINEIIEEIKTSKLVEIRKITDYKMFSRIFNNSISKEEYDELYSERINLIKIEKIEQKLNEINQIITSQRENIEKEWDKYNKNYKKHINNQLNEYLIKLKEEKNRRIIVSTPDKILGDYYCFYKRMIEINTSRDIMKIFADSTRKYVIFGKNGAGKTRLLNHIRKNYFNSNSFVMPSDREIRFGRLEYLNMDYKDKYPLSIIFKEQPYIYANDVLTVLFGDKLTLELQDEETTISGEEGNRRGISYDKFLRIFNTLGLDRKAYLDISARKIKLYNNELGIEPYYVEDASDGEKSIIQFILFILLCPKNSFVFIDEPESHFNTALLNELFNILEKEREDIVFIYCTHNIDFIELRTNAKLIYLEKFDGTDWTINEFNSFDEISIENIINIVGTKKDILFIESEKGKLDYRIYCSLFKDYKVIPVSSCDKVINNCKIINGGSYLNLNRKTYGIIDNDFKNQSEIEKLKESKVYTLAYNEIENLLFSPCILEYICEKYGLGNKLEMFKEAVIKNAINGKDGIISDYINKVYPKYQKSSTLTYEADVDKFRKQVKTVNEQNTADFIDNMKAFVEELEQDLASKNYEVIIKKYPNKGFLNCVKMLDIRVDLYISWVIDSLEKDESFRERIKSELFENYFE